MNVAVGLMDGLGLDGDRCIRVIPRHREENWAKSLLLLHACYVIVYIDDFDKS